ncbi:alpha/beta fold hydrolase [Shewanella canadensis]|uniref:Alpha/beta fold hydrolase n=1 Tax=Shewanella canadensis TaxID=271096 RepID=A0A3S0RUE5_9GAMM|nr:alpha/beta fold hydrolase [Shewanella canadensis]RTR36496.1 alpha/beta fold hydrolase [Shewanella canadensis]
MRTIVIGSTKHLILALIYASLGIAIALLTVGVWLLNSRPDLDIWHTTQLTSEYDRRLELTGFTEYQELEKRLFEELETEIYSHTTGPHSSILNRYVHGSLADPKKWRNDWNRTYEWPLPDARFGVLLLHGMSDSPYALSHVAKHFKGEAHLLGLRLPGHGTIPSGLVALEWQDMASAVSLATRHMREVLKGRPLYVVGFSTGAALALNHELERLSKNQEMDYAGMIFISPAIGLPPVAAGAKWQARLGQMLGLEKLSWNSIQTEYDPFKYNSFAVNAGDVVYQLAERNQAIMDKLSAEQLLTIPPILSFQSITDATVSSLSVISDLYLRLPDNGHQLVMFDINRTQVNMSLIPYDPLSALNELIRGQNLQFEYTLIENLNDSDESLSRVQATSHVFDRLPTSTLLTQRWPRNVYSLSHVALPYPMEDSLYGPEGVHFVERVQIGAASSRGERGVLNVSADEILRQKWNPFFPYTIQKIDDFLLSLDIEP